MPRILPLLALLFVAACGPRHGTAPSSTSPSSLSAEIAAAEQAWARGVVAADTVALTRLLAPEFVLLGTDTTRPFPRSAWMTNVATRRVATDSIAIDGLAVTGTADSAVATLSFWWRPVIEGQQQPADPTRLRDTWVRREGRWQVVERRRLE